MPVEKISFLVDEKGRNISVVVPIKEYQALVEDLAGLAVIAERTGEPAKPLALVKKKLEETWLNIMLAPEPLSI